MGWRQRVATVDKGSADEQAAARRTPWWRGLLILLGVVVVYVAVLLGYAAGDTHTGKDGRAAADGGVLVYIDIDAVNGADYSLDGHVSVYPGKDLVGDDGYLKNDLVIDLSPMAADERLVFKSGTRVGPLPVSLYGDGDIREWPFDQYDSDNVVVRAFSEASSPDAGTVSFPLPVEVAVTDSLTGWDIGADDQDPGAGQAFTISAERTAGSLVFDLALCVVLLVLPVCALFVSIQTVRRRKAFQPPMVTWFAVMLFAVLPLRNIFPGAPPFGSWVDYTVVLWVVAGLVTAMSLYVIAWWRQAP
jgi:hypothetical protein